VDDEFPIYGIFKEHLKDNELAEIIEFYQDPRECMKANKECDLAFIDICMPEINGFELARALMPTPAILFTGKPEYYKDMMDELHIIDNLTKPIIKEKLWESVKKAHQLIKPEKLLDEYVLFHTPYGKKNILLDNIQLVRIIKNTDGHLEIFLKDNKKQVITGYTLDDIRKFAGFLNQPNRYDLVSPKAIDLIDHNNIIHFNGITENGEPVHSELSISFKDRFYSKLPELKHR